MFLVGQLSVGQGLLIHEVF